MQGFVNQSCEAIIRVAVGHANSPKQMVDAVIDTGFTGFLSLPLATITRLGLPWHFRDIGTLGDGSAGRDVLLTHIPPFEVSHQELRRHTFSGDEMEGRV